MHVSGATQNPPFLQSAKAGLHTGILQSTPVHCDGHRHVPGATHEPPLAHVLLHIGVVQLESNHPDEHVHVSGAVHDAPL